MRRALPYVFAIALAAIGFSQLRFYGVTWDEALGDLFFGQRYLSFFTSFDTRYLDFAHDPYPAGYVPDLRASPFRSLPFEYWPVANTLAAATSRVLSNGLGFLDPFDGFHAFNLLAAALLLVVLYRFVERNVSTAAAIAATLILFLMPRVVCDLMANIKDFPEMVFFALTLMAFFAAFERASVRGVIASGLLWGLALGTKPNAVFLPLIVAAWIAIRGRGAWRGRERSLAIALGAAAFAGVAVMIAAWPTLWWSPGQLLLTFRYLTSRAAHAGDLSLINGWLALLTTTPPLVLLAAACGIVLLARRAAAREPFAALIVAWLGVVALRITLGGVNFDGVRHFLEIFPPLAIAAAIAATSVRRRAIAALLVALPVLNCAYATAASHPFETAYWNTFVGGYRGAVDRNLPQAGDYWGASYRLGLAWINRAAPRDSFLIVPIAGHTVRLVAPLRLRPDIRLVDFPSRVGSAATQRAMLATRMVAARHPVYVMFILRKDWATELDADCVRRLQPVHMLTLQGTPVLLIYRYTP